MARRNGPRLPSGLNAIQALLDSACSDSACTEPQQQVEVCAKQAGVTPAGQLTPTGA
jgi:hypothetical protein